MRYWFPLLAVLGSVCVSTIATEPAATRPITLTECIELALEKNLELRIERYYPQFAVFNLAAARAGYEPTLSLSGQHSHDESGTQLLSGGFEVPGAETDIDQINGSLTGLTPWGMTYGLRAGGSEASGESFSLDVNTNLVSTPFDNSRGSVSIELSQPLLKNFWIDGTRLTIALAKNQVRSSQQTLKARVIDVITRVELAYYDLEYAHESLKVQQKGLELAQRLLDENRKRVEVGALAPLDEKQSEAEVAVRKADLIAAQRNLDFFENTLKQLLTDDFAAWTKQRLEPVDGLATERQLLDLQDSWTRGLTQRPELLQAKLDLERSGIQLKYDRNQLYPQLDVFGEFGYNGSGDVFDDAFQEIGDRDRPFYLVGGRLIIPLGNGAARNRYKSSQAGREQALLGVKKLEQDIMVQIDNAIKLAQANYERIGATRQAREYREAALAAEQKKLENGKSTSFVVLQLQRDLTVAQSEEINALVQYRRALASLAQAEGTTLERQNIDMVGPYAPVIMSPSQRAVEMPK